MELEEIKLRWKKQETISYSDEELSSIFNIKINYRLEELRKDFNRDLIIAIGLVVGFIVILKVINLRTSDFWSISMALLGVSHLLFYRLQVYFINKYSIFRNNVIFSINETYSKLRVMLWLYRLWPTSLSLILFVTYIYQFNPPLAYIYIIAIGTALGIGVAVLSYWISGLLIKKQLDRLIAIKRSFETAKR